MSKIDNLLDDNSFITFMHDVVGSDFGITVSISNIFVDLYKVSTHDHGNLVLSGVFKRLVRKCEPFDFPVFSYKDLLVFYKFFQNYNSFFGLLRNSFRVSSFPVSDDVVETVNYQDTCNFLSDCIPDLIPLGRSLFSLYSYYQRHR